MATLLAHLVPPVLIVVAVTLQPLVAGFLAELLTAAEHNTALASRTEPRLEPDTIVILALVKRVSTAMSNGQLREWDGTGMPSISAIQRLLRCEKRRAQAVWDALRILTQPTAGHTATPGTSQEITDEWESP